MGQGQVVGRLIHCLTCESEWAIQAGTIQTSVNPTVPVSLETLLAETYPRFAVVNAERLELEKALQHDPFSLDAQTRLALIAEPFFVLDNDLRKDDTRTSWLRVLSGMAFVLAVLFILASVAAFTSDGVLWGVVWLVAAAAVGWVGVRLTRAVTDIFLREKIYPRLASCLAPLDPSPEELAAILGHIESKCAHRTKLQTFLPFLEQARSSVKAAQAAVGR